MQIEQLDAYLGEGTDSLVYSVRGNDHIVAKVSKSNNQNLLKEAEVLSTLTSTNLFPKIYAVGKMKLGIQSDTSLPLVRDFLIMEKLGISLEEFLILRYGNISIGTVKKIGTQLLGKIRVLHSKKIVHNDIKPANILFGMKDRRNEVFLVDFGLSDLQDNDKDERNQATFKGNIKFCSLRKLKGLRGQKIDDLESLLYVTIWMLLGGRDISDFIDFYNQNDVICVDKAKMNLKQTFARKIQQRLFFLQNAQQILKHDISEEKLTLILKICAVLAICAKQQCEYRPDQFYNLVEGLLR